MGGGAMTALALLLKNWKTALAGLAILAALGYGATQKIHAIRSDRDAARAEVRAIAAEAETAEALRQIAVQNEAKLKADKLADAERERKLEAFAVIAQQYRDAQEERARHDAELEAALAQIDTLPEEDRCEAAAARLRDAAVAMLAGVAP